MRALGATTGEVVSMLFGVQLKDAVAVGGAVTRLSAAALLASLIPAWRGSRVDPLLALREE